MTAKKAESAKAAKPHIGKVKKNAFHEWLGKDPKEPITDADIEKGLASDDADVRKMATFAKNAKKWKHDKSSNEDLAATLPASLRW